MISYRGLLKMWFEGGGAEKGQWEPSMEGPKTQWIDRRIVKRINWGRHNNANTGCFLKKVSLCRRRRMNREKKLCLERNQRTVVTKETNRDSGGPEG